CPRPGLAIANPLDEEPDGRACLPFSWPRLAYDVLGRQLARHVPRQSRGRENRQQRDRAHDQERRPQRAEPGVLVDRDAFSTCSGVAEVAASTLLSSLLVTKSAPSETACVSSLCGSSDWL